MTAILNRYAIIAVALACIIGGLIYIGVSFERDRRALDDARNHIETREDIDNALSADRDCFWLDRLRASCP